MNNLTIKNFERAKYLHDEIVKMDSEIIEIEKIADEVAQDRCGIEFNLKIENHSAEKKEKTRVLDSDGSLFNHHEDDGMGMGMGSGYIRYMQGMIPTTASKEPSNQKQYSFKFSESDCLRLLAVIHDLKCRQRRIAINELERIGVAL